jgi:hypothetical protein
MHRSKRPLVLRPTRALLHEVIGSGTYKRVAVRIAHLDEVFSAGCLAIMIDE